MTAPLLYAQDVAGSSTVTLGVGDAWNQHHADGIHGGPAFQGNYEFRWTRYLSLEAGLSASLTTSPGPEFSSLLAGTSLVTYYGSLNSSTARVHSHLLSVPFGARGILPVADGWVELFTGLGGDYLWNSGRSYTNGWAVQGKLGARVAIDKQRHFWVGTTGNYVHGLSYSQNWTSWTADVGFRFGR